MNGFNVIAHVMSKLSSDDTTTYVFVRELGEHYTTVEQLQTYFDTENRIVCLIFKKIIEGPTFPSSESNEPNAKRPRIMQMIGREEGERGNFSLCTNLAAGAAGAAASCQCA